MQPQPRKSVPACRSACRVPACRHAALHGQVDKIPAGDPVKGSCCAHLPTERYPVHIDTSAHMARWRRAWWATLLSGQLWRPLAGPASRWGGQLGPWAMTRGMGGAVSRHNGVCPTLNGSRCNYRTMGLMARRRLTAAVSAASLTAGHDHEPPGRCQGSEQGEHSSIPSVPCVGRRTCSVRCMRGWWG